MSDEPLTRCIAELRQQLGDSRTESRYIQTIPKRGYRLVANVCRDDEGAETPAATPDVEAEPAGRAPDVAADAPPAHAEPILSLPLLAGLVAAIVLAVASVWFARDRAVLQPRATTVAVLPFDDLSPGGDQQYFADGIHEEIITRLSANPALEVVSRTSVMPYRGRTATVREIARALGAGAVIEGSVRYAEGRVRVTAQLIDARTDRNLWAENFDRELTLQDLFAIQAEIAERVAEGLEARFDAAANPATASLPTRDFAAYDEFLLGKYHYRKLQPEDLRLSVQHFQRAVERDPGFAEAWDWLAYAWNHSGTEQGWTTPRDAYPRARAAAVRALELDPRLASSRALLGYLRAVYDWDFAGGLGELEQAMRQDPSDTGTAWSYAYVLSVTGQHERAVEVTRALADASPDVGRVRLELAYRLNDAGRFAEAMAEAERALALGVDGGLAYDVIGMAALGLGDAEGAIAAFEQAAALQRRAPDILGHLAHARARAGRADEARVLLAELETAGQSVYVSPMAFASIHAGLGDADAMFRMLEQAAEERARGFLFVGWSPLFTAYREDSRFEALLARTRPVGR
jgi:TolB-like protein/Tfp pilus assembly protein PilF